MDFSRLGFGRFHISVRVVSFVANSLDRARLLQSDLVQTMRQLSTRSSAMPKLSQWSTMRFDRGWLHRLREDDVYLDWWRPHCYQGILTCRSYSGWSHWGHCRGVLHNIPHLEVLHKEEAATVRRADMARGRNRKSRE